MDLGNRSGAPGKPTGSQLLGVLSAVLTAMRDSGGYPDVLTRICRALVETVPCDRSTVYVWSRRRKAFLPAADHGTPAEVVQDFVRRGFGRGSFPGEDELRAGRAVFAVRGSTTPELEDILRLARLHALAVVPLFLHGRAEGTLSCGVDQP
ncbi:MAG TPA: GAF domain-containing protein, partial [Candidatus Binatus sp.]|nr:GAF domain-containing protein [Candidatus Binatus sp.]